MRAALFFLMLFVPTALLAETVINYDDGSTYTLGEDERVYVGKHGKYFIKKTYSKGDVYFKVAGQNTKRDYVEQPTDGLEVGGHEWCLAYEPWSEGLTFSMLWWQRACDSNNDGVYDEQDDGWEG